MSLEKRLQEIWYGGAPVPLVLRALVPVYRGLRALHRAPYAFGWRQPQRLPVPVIVVGNITVGGTGKTPLVIVLVEALRAQGRKPGVISRGYGGSAGSPILVDSSSNAALCGDEPVLIRRATGVPVAVGRDRVAAAQLLLAASDGNEPAVDIIVADDGLQHYPLFRNVEICVIDGERRFGNGLLLPAGPLREPLARLDTLAFCVCNGGLAQAGEIPMRMVGDTAVAVGDAATRRSLHDFAGQRVHAVAGIGNPARFFALLRAAGIDAIEHAFADHYPYQPRDLDFGDGLPVLMTEKDAIKCAAFAHANLWQVPVRAELPREFFDALARERI
ncbi:MAG TPA: tetraacyldisaccharide 4'-kinase [Rudaea sp.]|jgi:tetraacyldisaccharide 4'-kinase|uniref:tetraacyldisaccharide 4'-kinase n=1 Tax=Rudaea sp. TaxID=2136325 RepID=UPI002F92DCC1